MAVTPRSVTQSSGSRGICTPEGAGCGRVGDESLSPMTEQQRMARDPDVDSRGVAPGQWRSGSGVGTVARTLDSAPAAMEQASLSVRALGSLAPLTRTTRRERPPRRPQTRGR